MTTKILFWVDRLLYHYGIAKYIQKNYSCEMSAIYEVDSKLKKVFQEQNSVKFQKEWYFWDEVKINNKPDFNYLKTIEKKYNINLWLWAYNDRLLFGYNQLYQFNYDEILSITEQTCRFYEHVLDTAKPDYLIIKNTDSHRTHLLKLICDARNIKTLMITKPRITGRMTIKHDPLHSVTNNKIDEITKSNLDIEEIRKQGHASKHHGKLALSTTIPLKQKILPALRWLIRPLDKNYNKSYTTYGLSKSRVLKIQLLTYIRNRYRKKFIDQNFIKNINPNQKFVYYALHVQPERTVSIDSPFNNNQINIITNIAKSIPVDCLVYVKEHPTQIAYAWRPISYYKQIMALPNVIMLHPSVNSEDLIKKCSIVATIGGTVGLECGFFNKHCITFTETEFSHLSYVHKIKDIEELPKKIRDYMDKEVEKKEIENFYEKVYDDSFELDELEIDNDIMNTFFHGNWTMRHDISINELDQFFEDRQSTYEELAMKFIKYIEMTDIKN